MPTEFTFTSSRIGDTFSVSATATKIDPRGDYNWYLLENSKADMKFTYIEDANAVSKIIGNSS